MTDLYLLNPNLSSNQLAACLLELAYAIDTDYFNELSITDRVLYVQCAEGYLYRTNDSSDEVKINLETGVLERREDGIPLEPISGELYIQPDAYEIFINMALVDAYRQWRNDGTVKQILQHYHETLENIAKLAVEDRLSELNLGAYVPSKPPLRLLQERYTTYHATRVDNDVDNW